MPYELEKFKKGWFVCNIETGKRYSKKPMTKRNALKQLHILRTAYLHSDEHGGSIYNAIKNRLTSLYKGPRKDYSPDIRKLLEKIGDFNITRLQICREPVQSAVKKMVNILTLGKFEESLKKYGFDNVYHLFLILEFNDTKKNMKRQVIVEKNHVINISEKFKISDNVVSMPVDSIPADLTINNFLNNAKEAMGDNDYFLYDAFKNNCQVYIDNLLQHNNLLTPELHNFIFQDVSQLAKEMPRVSSSIMKGLTDVAGVADTAIFGAKLTKIKTNL